MLYSIQALRAIAASAVALRHSMYFVDVSSAAAFPVSNYISGLGSAGVHIFFVVSGFIMMWTNQDASSNWRSFLRKRFSRIYPSYWLIAALSIPVALYLGAQLPDTAEKWFGAFLLLPEGASSLIFVGWTLAYEVYFYLLFALALALGLPAFYRVLWLTVFFVASIFVGVFLLPPSLGFMGLPKLATSVLLLEFAAGAWIGWMATRGFKVTTSTASAMILVAVAGLQTISFGHFMGYPKYFAGYRMRFVGSAWCWSKVFSLAQPAWGFLLRAVPHTCDSHPANSGVHPTTGPFESFRISHPLICDFFDQRTDLTSLFHICRAAIGSDVQSATRRKNECEAQVTIAQQIGTFCVSEYLLGRCALIQRPRLCRG